MKRRLRVKNIVSVMLALLFMLQPLSVFADSGFEPVKAVAGIFQLFGFDNEKEYDDLLADAQEFFEEGSYADVFRTLNSIDTEYSKYAEVNALYKECENAVLAFVSAPDDIELFEAFINLLDECYGLYGAEAFVVRREEIIQEWAIFAEIEDCIYQASEKYDSWDYEEAFFTLELGLQKYPDSEKLINALVDYHNHYVITVTKQVMKLCDEEEYKDALDMVEKAIEEYDCDEFRQLSESIKEQKNPFYKFKNDLVAKFASMTHGANVEKFDVKQAAENAGAYVVKSGKKLMLGDYAEEDVTLLSFGGNIITSIAGLDIAFDLRDLSYDLTHWGEDSYFAVYLAADVIALLPVIGLVKYLDFKKVEQGAEVVGEFVDSVTDIGKNADNAAEIVDAVKDVNKTGNNIIDAIDTAKRTADDILSTLTKEYKTVSTINSKYLGDVYPGTDVEFVLRKVKYVDGNMIKGVFPVFDAIAEMDLPEELYKATFNDQQKYLIEQLQKKTKFFWSKLRKEFTEEQLETIKSGKLPKGFTWHHNEQEGLMQLVDTETHNAVRHTGGMSLWGIGYGGCSDDFADVAPAQ